MIILRVWGEIGIGFLLFQAAGIIATLISGKKTGVAIILTGFVVMLIFGLLVNYKLIITDYNSGIFRNPVTWISTFIVVFVVYLTIISAIERFNHIMMDLVDNLELKVDQRTNDLNIEILERKKIEKELITAKMSAEESNNAKTVFLAGITHEIRTPLNAIIGYSQLLRRESDFSDEQKKQLDSITYSGEHLLSIINEILEMSKIEAGITSIQNETFKLNKMIDQLKLMFKLKASKKGIDLIIDIDESVPELIQSDPNKIRQVMINLIGNSLKFTTTGYIKLSVKPINSDFPFIEVNVEDTGPGIEEKEIIKIFSPFEQTKSGRIAGGTGLGLSISRKYANLLGGDISVTSTLGKGSFFSFTFSYKDGNPEDTIEEVQERTIVSIKKGGTRKILVVDDRESNRDILNKILTPLGFVVIEAVNGYDALEKVEQYTPEIILLDIVMPELNGIEVIKRVRAMADNEQYIIIVITASALEEDKSKVLEYGANSFIRKPFKPQLILEEIGRFAGIEYNYEDFIDENKHTGLKVTASEINDFLNSINNDILNKLSDFLDTGQSASIRELILNMPVNPVRSYLSELIDDYEFETVLSIIKRWKNDRL